MIVQKESQKNKRLCTNFEEKECSYLNNHITKLNDCVTKLNDRMTKFYNRIEKNKSFGYPILNN